MGKNNNCQSQIAMPKKIENCLLPHFLQSKYWAEFQKSLNRPFVLKSDDGWSCLAIEEKGSFSNRLYCPFGPTAKSFADFEDVFSFLIEETKRRDLDFLRVEPRYSQFVSIDEEDMLKLGFKKAFYNVQPQDTAINALFKLTSDDGDFEPLTDDEIVSKCSQLPRRIFKKLDKSGVKYSISYDPCDIEIFLKMIKEVSERTGFTPFSDQCYENIGKALFPLKAGGLSFAYKENNGKKEYMSGIIFYKDNKMMSYAHAASFDKYRKDSPSTGLVLKTLMFAKDQGLKHFDFHGIAPANVVNHKWSGFTRFKLSFGGERVGYSGTWEMPVKNLRYKTYLGLLKTFKALKITKRNFS
ncbi:MAG: peptidoglycan bridge formation glycyltransferase FemA/FemB family protein [Oscillospiraceae bacterium]|jgi:hypothetical protein|nr:peptidoglycan bridge formation glycyltransferase FemA/FemB family protein [Oscillospiraceae bacterium]